MSLIDACLEARPDLGWTATEHGAARATVGTWSITVWAYQNTIVSSVEHSSAAAWTSFRNDTAAEAISSVLAKVRQSYAGLHTLLGPERADGWTTKQVRSLAWASVYGASVAAQVESRTLKGHGPVSDTDMDGIIEEAQAVADLAAAAAGRAWR